MKKINLSLIMIICVFAYPNLIAGDITKIEGADLNLASRWDSAIKAGHSEHSFLIGYSIKRLMGENSYIGLISEDSSFPSLAEVISGKVAERAVQNSDSRFKRHVWNDKKSVEKIIKNIAIIFEVKKTKGNNFQINKVEMNNLELPFDFQEMNMFWLGNTNQDESVTFLKKEFGKTGYSELKEDLVTAIGIHDNNHSAYVFLKEVIDGSNADDVREQAVFWIAHHENKEVLPLLKKIALEDRSEDISEKAVFGLYVLGSEDAIDILIDLAKKVKRNQIREKAMFWLGQTASKKAVETIENAVYNDEETEIQKQAVFALSQLDSDEGLTKLIKVAKIHPNPEIRKKAIFWLGQTDDDRALDAIIGFLKN